MSTTETTKTRIPAPFYAAAGAGDLAYRELRKLPARFAGLQDRVVTTPEFDVDKLRGVARRNADLLVTRAHAAQERAVALYTDLVTRGERVVRGGTHATKAKVAELEQTVAADASKAKKSTRPAPPK